MHSYTNVWLIMRTSLVDYCCANVAVNCLCDSDCCISGVVDRAQQLARAQLALNRWHNSLLSVDRAQQLALNKSSVGYLFSAGRAVCVNWLFVTCQ